MSEIVYFAKCESFVKIGTTRNLDKRLMHLIIGCPFPIDPVWFMTGSMVTEKQLHERFSSHHHRGEWFHWCDPIHAYIVVNAELHKNARQLKLENPDPVEVRVARILKDINDKRSVGLLNTRGLRRRRANTVNYSRKPSTPSSQFGKPVIK